MVWRGGGARTIIMAKRKGDLESFIRAMPAIPAKMGGVKGVDYRPAISPNVQAQRIKFSAELDDYIARESLVTAME